MSDNPTAAAYKTHGRCPENMIGLLGRPLGCNLAAEHKGMHHDDMTGADWSAGVAAATRRGRRQVMAAEPSSAARDGAAGWCPPHDWRLQCPTCGNEEPVSEAGGVDAFCWLFTALRHGGDEADPTTWTMHLPTAQKAVALLGDRGIRVLLPSGCDCDS